MHLRLPRRALAAAAFGAFLPARAARAVAAEPALGAGLDAGGQVAAGSTPAEFAAMIAAQRTHVVAGLAARGAARP